MKILIVEDDIFSRKFLQKFLSGFGNCKTAINAIEGVDFFLTAHKEKKPFNLICLDIMMPKIDGISMLKTIRNFEEQKYIDKTDAVKIIMMSALSDKKTVMESYESGCDAYVSKPLDINKITEIFKKLKLI
jgi:two-component system chemotaxis response regulator CheY